MSTSLLYHGFGLRGYDYVKTDYEKKHVIFSIEQKPGTLCCPACICASVILHGRQERTFQTVPIGCKRVLLKVKIPRVECRRCGVIRQVKLGFADPRHGYTRAFERHVLEL